MHKYRPDLTDYEIYVRILSERLNEDSVFKMSGTDTIKLLIEKAMQNYCPNVKIRKNRKKYQALKF
jgi:hypothetical protein